MAMVQKDYHSIDGIRESVVSSILRQRRNTHNAVLTAYFPCWLRASCVRGTTTGRLLYWANGLLPTVWPTAKQRPDLTVVGGSFTEYLCMWHLILTCYILWISCSHLGVAFVSLRKKKP